MIFLKRRRLLFWLIKAYFKKHGKTVLLSFLAGLFIFSILIFSRDIFIKIVPFSKKETIGLVGAYNINNIPFQITQKVSKGLTFVSEDGQAKPDLATSWKIEDDGRKYTFYIRRNIYFSDKAPFTSKSVNYDFSNVSVERPDDYTIIFKLKDSYSPFLITVSSPIFKKGFVGVGDYKIIDLNLNGNFIESIKLLPVRGEFKEIIYQFYPTEEALKTSFVLGEISKMQNLHNLRFKDAKFSSFKSLTIERKTSNDQLATLFYNTQDSLLSDKRLRSALSYSLPDSFPMGERNIGPFHPKSWAGQEYVPNYPQYDLAHAQLLIAASQTASGSAKTKLSVKALPQYEEAAKVVVASFKKINVEASVQIVETIPSSFQIFLGDFNLSRDPDQYALWHSSQISNITKYKNLRIDKLLEDGRKEIDINNRKKIYANFEKYFFDDPPASFLFLPYLYDVSRK